MAKINRCDVRPGCRLATAALLVMAGSAALKAQCNDDEIVCVSSGDSISRFDSNNVIAELNDQILGPGADSYEVCLDAWLVMNGAVLDNPMLCSGGYGEYDLRPIRDLVVPNLRSWAPLTTPLRLTTPCPVSKSAKTKKTDRGT